MQTAVPLDPIPTITSSSLTTAWDSSPTLPSHPFHYVDSITRRPVHYVPPCLCTANITALSCNFVALIYLLFPTLGTTTLRTTLFESDHRRYASRARLIMEGWLSDFLDFEFWVKGSGLQRNRGEIDETCSAKLCAAERHVQTVSTKGERVWSLATVHWHIKVREQNFL